MEMDCSQHSNFIRVCDVKVTIREFLFYGAKPTRSLCVSAGRKDHGGVHRPNGNGIGISTTAAGSRNATRANVTQLGNLHLNGSLGLDHIICPTPSRRRDLVCDMIVARIGKQCGLTAEVGGVSRGEIGPLFRQIVQRKNGGYRTNGNAGATIDALYRIDV
jgi:hypothetical protein